MKRIYWTKIRGVDKTFGCTDYVRGRINGFSEVLCGLHVRPICVEPENGDRYICVKCTEEQYQAFQNLVEKRYPGLCEFDVEYEE